MPIDSTQRHIWRFDGKHDLPKGQPKHGDISLTKQDTPDGWRRLNVIATYEGPLSRETLSRPVYLLCEDDMILTNGKDRRTGCPFHFAASQWLLRVSAGNDRHDFTLQECLEMPPLLDALGVNDLKLFEHL